MVEFLTSSRIAANHSDFKEFGYKSCLQKIAPFAEKTNEFTHPFRLSNAYSTDVMPYSNYTYDFKGLIDHVFYSKNTMVPLGLLGPVDAEWFRENKILGCPHRDIPSGKSRADCCSTVRPVESLTKFKVPSPFYIDCPHSRLGMSLPAVYLAHFKFRLCNVRTFTFLLAFTSKRLNAFLF